MANMIRGGNAEAAFESQLIGKWGFERDWGPNGIRMRLSIP